MNTLSCVAGVDRNAGRRSFAGVVRIHRARRGVPRAAGRPARV